MGWARQPGFAAAVAVVAGAEARRLSRSPAIVGLRTGYAAVAVGLGLVFGAGRLAEGIEPYAVGADLLSVLRDLHLLLGLLLAPILVAVATVRDSEDALDLIRITRLAPAAVAFGQLVGRGLVPLSIGLGGLPVLSAVAWLGGVAPIEVVATFVNGTALHVAAAVIAAAVAQRTRRVVPAVLVALTVIEIASFRLPWTALADAVGGTVGVPCAIGIAVPLVFLLRGRAILERPPTRGAAATALVGAIAAVVAARIGSHPALTVLASAALAGAAIDGGSWLFLPGSREERPSRTVGADPVRWWALSTSGPAGASAVRWLVVAGWSLWLFDAFWRTPGDPLREASLDPGRVLLVVGVAATATAAASAIVDSAGIVEALAATPVTGLRIAGGLLVGVGVRSLPWLIAGAALRDRPLLDVPWIVAWWAAAATLCCAVGARLPPAGAWAAALVGAYGFVQGLAVAPLLPGGEDALAIFAPLLLDGPVRPHTGASAALHLAIAAASLAATAAAVRPSGRR